MGDIIYHHPKNKCSTLKDSSVQLDAKENLREADQSEVNEWAVSLKRPITFLVKRKQENIASLVDDNIKCDHLKIDIEQSYEKKNQTMKHLRFITLSYKRKVE